MPAAAAATSARQAAAEESRRNARVVDALPATTPGGNAPVADAATARATGAGFSARETNKTREPNRNCNAARMPTIDPQLRAAGAN